MNNIEKLQDIRAKCVELLEIAEKRTPGRWKQGDDNHESVEIGGIVGCCYLLRWNNGQGPNDAAFIASCAGPAEAGWKATIAAIDAFLPYWIEADELGANTHGARFEWNQRAQAILKAWEGLA